MANTNELDYSRKVADGERLELIMRQVASRFKLDGNVLAEALLDIHERLKAVEGATEELTSSDRWKAFKTVQLVKPSPSASGDTVTAIDTVAQDENGELTATKKNIRQGTTSQKGIVQLSDATNSTSTTLAATANAVKTAYDLAASKQDAVSTDTDSSEFGDSTSIATGFGGNKIHLNVASRLWNYIKGKLGISSSGSSTKFLNEQGEWTTVTTPDVSGKADKVTGATAGDVATLDANGNLVDSGMTLGASVPADASFTDDKVAQMMADSSSDAYPLLMAGTADPRGRATVARYDSGVTLDPSTNTIAANISGNATTATTASSTLSGTISADNDLNDYNAANRNYQCNATNASSVSNKPSGASGAFELEVIRGTGNTCVQVYYSRDDVNFNYIRKRTGLNNGTWTGWVKMFRDEWVSFTPDTLQTTEAAKIFAIGNIEVGYYFDSGSNFRLSMRSTSGTRYVYLADQHGNGGGYALTTGWTGITIYGFTNSCQLEILKGYDTTGNVNLEFDVYYANGVSPFVPVAQYRVNS